MSYIQTLASFLIAMSLSLNAVFAGEATVQDRGSEPGLSLGGPPHARVQIRGFSLERLQVVTQSVLHQLIVNFTRFFASNRKVLWTKK